MKLRILVLTLLVLLAAGPSSAVILASADGTDNTGAPVDDPGWYYVGSQGGATAVYLGEGWVITANHVGGGSPSFSGVSYAVVPGSTQQLQNPDGTPAGLRVFRVNPYPPLPPLAILPAAPSVGSQVVLIGRGRDRGDATTWSDSEVTTWSSHEGWLYGGTSTMRWGTNTVAAVNLDVLSNRAFSMNFSKNAGSTTFESQSATGDSGGAAFIKSGGVWYLAGILYAVGPYENQPSNMALYGNLSYAAQLSDYAANLLVLAGTPVCSDGLDNDSDGAADYPADSGCQSRYSYTENPACSDGLDNDLDGLIDLQDGVCGGQPWYPTESVNACGLGFEVALLLPILAALRRRR